MRFILYWIFVCRETLIKDHKGKVSTTMASVAVIVEEKLGDSKGDNKTFTIIRMSFSNGDNNVDSTII